MDGNKVIDLTETSAESEPANSSLNSSTMVDVSVSDVSVLVDDPNKIRRTVPLRLRGADPAQCFDILDQMYELYYKQEVNRPQLLLPLLSVCIDGFHN